MARPQLPAGDVIFPSPSGYKFADADGSFAHAFESPARAAALMRCSPWRIRVSDFHCRLLDLIACTLRSN